ncbi:MAG: cobyric acid synthase [Proteobacteria bacterium]|nr:cobyric acid synthase [Pseudomonadota bacterium]
MTATSASTAPVVMIQGTASSVGKSLLTAALCRIFYREGRRVAPFKAQNMALNSFVTPQGAEIGRAQAVQAEAACTDPSVWMNPILLKPEGDARSQVVVMGKPIGSMTALEYHAYKPTLRSMISDCLVHLRRHYDLVVIEGAGSPAEINLKEHDIVNMDVARVADAPVLLVGDIDRGGVFAALVGTLELLEPDERRRIKGFIINKFRGDPSLLDSGLEFLVRRTSIPVVGVVPHIDRLRIADEDSVSLEHRMGQPRGAADQIDIAVLRLPRISNYDDVLALEYESGVVVRFVERPSEIGGADLIIVPGSKSTVADLAWLRETGLDQSIVRHSRAGRPILGICGGFQMLGHTILDPDRVESAHPSVRGLGLLAIETRFQREKITAQVRARAVRQSFLVDSTSIDREPGDREPGFVGYEIHMGRSERLRQTTSGVDSKPVDIEPLDAGAFEIISRNGETVRVADGAVSADGTVVGTMIHGLLENAAIRASLLRFLRARKGLAEVHGESVPHTDAEYNRLASCVRDHLDMAMLRDLIGL